MTGGPSDFLLPGTDQPVAGGFMAPAPADTGGGGFQSLIDKFTSNPAMLLAAAPLAMSLFGGGNQQYPQEKSLQTLATNLGTQGQGLAGYLQSGTLPAGLQASVDASKKAGEAQVRSAAARTGTSGSTMEAQELAGVDQRAAGQGGLLATQLLGEGLKAQQGAAGIYGDLLKTQMTEDAQFRQALMSFAGGLARGGWQQPTTPVSGYG